jgi:hypothetical protein
MDNCQYLLIVSLKQHTSHSLLAAIPNTRGTQKARVYFKFSNRAKNISINSPIYHVQANAFLYGILTFEPLGQIQKLCFSQAQLLIK